MLIVIFGCEGCLYCVCVKDVVEKLVNECDDFKYCYIDIIKEGISKVDLEQFVGKFCLIVLQIFID